MKTVANTTFRITEVERATQPLTELSDKDQATGDAAMPIRELFAGGAGDLDEMLHRKKRARRAFVAGPTIESFPGGLSKAPFRWNYLDRGYDMELLGGFVGVAQDSVTLTLRPEIGWAVRETPGGA